MHAIDHVQHPTQPCEYYESALPAQISILWLRCFGSVNKRMVEDDEYQLLNNFLILA